MLGKRIAGEVPLAPNPSCLGFEASPSCLGFEALRGSIKESRSEGLRDRDREGSIKGSLSEILLFLIIGLRWFSK